LSRVVATRLFLCSARISEWRYIERMTEPALSPDATDALKTLCEKPGAAISPAAFEELCALDFAMGKPERAHPTQRGKTYCLTMKET